jgi:hypothetical protein
MRFKTCSDADQVLDAFSLFHGRGFARGGLGGIGLLVVPRLRRTIVRR